MRHCFLQKHSERAQMCCDVGAWNSGATLGCSLLQLCTGTTCNTILVTSQVLERHERIRKSIFPVESDHLITLSSCHGSGKL